MHITNQIFHRFLQICISIGLAVAASADLQPDPSALARHTLSCVYSHDFHQASDTTCQLDGVFSPAGYQSLVDYTKKDENFVLTREYQLTMREVLSKSIVKSLKQTDSAPKRWQVDTPFTLTMVKRHVEIHRSMLNTQIIRLETTPSNRLIVESFSTVETAPSQIIDYKKYREKNCSPQS